MYESFDGNAWQAETGHLLNADICQQYCRYGRGRLILKKVLKNIF